ncbi:MAG: hypothetical protein JO270_04235 [Acidobacteriaceae bacterium]|nr:hypothetical protein [Acidobacteriaceae bacterium]MBV8569062.1 hypothetical protein [Acidobacteriaceae bacterium]
MARGWESKEIESQMEAAAERHVRFKPERSAAEIAAERERESLELSRTRVLQDLAIAKNPKYRELLERSLIFLNSKLAELEH